MPAKKLQDTKAKTKEQQKIVEDKTFGLKNKNKSKAVQKYIKSVQAQVVGPIKGGESAVKAKAVQEKDEKKKAEKANALLNSLFKGAEAIKAIPTETNVIPYSPKGFRESQKINIYVDQRVQKAKPLPTEKDDTGPLETIEQITTRIESKFQTDIVCKYFLQAVEKKAYGWFWECPNGDACHYRHKVPPDWVPIENVTQPDEELTIEEIIEQELLDLPPDCTPITETNFMAWLQEKKNAQATPQTSKIKSAAPKLSGRNLFAFDPTLFVDEDGAANKLDYEQDDMYWDQIINAHDNQCTSMDSKHDEKREIIDDIGLQPINKDLFLDDLTEDY